jgi:prevent-host-death family protein
MTAIAITQAHHNLLSIVNRVFQTNERIIISQKGKNIAAIIGPEDIQSLKNLDELEDQILIEMADEAMKEPGENISLKEMKKMFDHG